MDPTFESHVCNGIASFGLLSRLFLTLVFYQVGSGRINLIDFTERTQVIFDTKLKIRSIFSVNPNYFIIQQTRASDFDKFSVFIEGDQMYKDIYFLGPFKNWKVL